MRCCFCPPAVFQISVGGRSGLGVGAWRMIKEIEDPGERHVAYILSVDLGEHVAGPQELLGKDTRARNARMRITTKEQQQKKARRDGG